MHFQTHPRYLYLAVISWVMVALFAWSLWRSFSGGSLFFLLVCLGTGTWYTWLRFSHVHLSADGVVLEPPLGAPREVGFRQLVSVTESGRIGRSVTVIYHPVQEDGFLNLNQAQSLNLPEVTEQHELVERLEAHVPK